MVKLMNHIIETYANYKEEDRLESSKARRVEYLTTMKALKEVIPTHSKILDSAAGTGIYAFELAKAGHLVTALDLTPRHVDRMKEDLKNYEFDMAIGLNDATDLSAYADESFDVVLCMGPLYHLVDPVMREKCLDEHLRVLKTSGLLVLSYISRYSVFSYVALSHSKYINEDLSKKLLETGIIKHDDPDSFWTDCYFATPEEMEHACLQRSVKVIDHLASDGIAPFVKEKIDNFSDADFDIWCAHHYAICRERSILGTSNHGLIMGIK